MPGLWHRLTRGVRRIVHRPDWPRFCGPDFADRIMTMPVTDRFHAKQGRSTGRVILRDRDEQLTVYLKRHFQLPWWRRLLATLWPGKGWSPAFQEKEHLEWAQRQGVCVPRVAAAGEFVGPAFALQSFLAIEELTDMLPLHEAAPQAQEQLSPRAFARWKQDLIEELARLTRVLHGAGRFHKDYYLCHFFIRPRDIEAAPGSFQGRVYLIDLHRLGRHSLTRRYWQVKDLAQLLYSSEIAGVTDHDRLRFFRLYRGEGQLGESSRRLFRAVLWKATRYRRHNRLSAVGCRLSAKSSVG